MKKHFLIVLALILAVLSFSACGQGQESGHEHAWGEWTVTKEATCTADGEQTRTCECGETEKQTIPAKGHKAGTKATCTDAQTCTVCSAKLVEAKGHAFGKWVTKIPATKTENGVKEQTCLGCGETKNETILPCGSEGLFFLLRDDGTYYVNKGSCRDNEVVIPATHNGKPVAGILNEAFYGYTIMKSIVIPDSVTSIGEKAFDRCNSLTSIVIPDSVTSVGDCAFYGCSSLTSVTIGNGVTSIGDGAFSNCSSLTSVTIGNRVRIIGEGAFRGCTGLASVVIGDSVMRIGTTAFSDCSSLTEISVQENNIYYRSENGILFDKAKTELICYPMGKTEMSYSIPDSVTSIGYSAFYRCSSLTSIEIPKGVTSIGREAFYYCDSLTSVVIPDSVTSIGREAFYYCSSLTSVVIPDSVTSIGEDAFKCCSSLTSIQFSGTVAQWKAISFGSGWNSYTGNYTVTCTDGTVTYN